MNKKGNIMINFLIFFMALIVVIAFISPINTILDLAQQSDNLNCKGFIYDSNATHTLSFNNLTDGGQSGSPLGCLALKLYLPYILLFFLAFGVFAVIGSRATNLMGLGGREETPY